MRTRRWNAKAFHRQHTNGPLGSGGRLGKSLAVVTALVVVGIATGAVGMAEDGEESKWVGVCHATGSSENPYVYMVVARDGAEHGHHAEHEDDIVGVSSPEECGITHESTADSEAASQPTCMTQGTAIEASEAEPAANESGNESVAETETVDICTADVATTAAGEVIGSSLVYTFTVTSVGPGEANQAVLTSVLPDVGWAWTLGGTDAADCSLEARNLSCDFGDMFAGQTRSVSVDSPRCAEDCGDDVEALVEATAFNDADATNDEALVVVEFPECGAMTGTDEAPTDGNESEPADETGNETPPAANESDPEGNETPPEGNDSAPEGNESAADRNESAANTSEPEPEPGDVAVRQSTQQDDFEVLATIQVLHVAGETVPNVTLSDALPDLRRPWLVEGADAASCTLEGNDLTCWFGDLAPGDSKTVILRAYTDRMPCGQHLTNTAIVSGDADPNAHNDRSSAGIAARAC